jgi:broad specificity phosphatase PhoE
MRTLEIRRHSHRHIPHPHLSQIGVELARRVGNGLGRFDRVVTSTVPRAFETAIAMGYAVDEQIERLSMMGDEVTAVISWNAGYAAWAQAAQDDPVVALYTQALGLVLRSIVQVVPAGGRALIVSHGGIVEAGTIGCLPPGMPIAGAACGYCEGARLTFDDEIVTQVEMLRVEQPEF